MSHDTDALTLMQKATVEMLSGHMKTVINDDFMSDLHENARRVLALLESNPREAEEIVRNLEGMRFVGMDENGNSTDPVQTLINIYTSEQAFGTPN